MHAILDGLDDVDALTAADREGLLRSAALAGAQVRAVAEARSEGAGEALAGLRPRAVVLVTGVRAVARHAAELVVAATAPRIDVPLAIVPALPGWIGPLDVVVLLGDDAGDPQLSDAAARALRRHAELVVAAPVEGPLAEAIDRRAFTDFSPRVKVAHGFELPALVAALIGTLDALTGVRRQPAPPELRELADALDAQALADQPSQESFHNQAKTLALRITGRPVVWAGDTAAAAAVAAHAATTLLTVAGAVGVAADAAGAVAELHRAALAPRVRPAVDPLFYDPDFDEQPPDEVPRLLLVSTRTRRWLAQQQIAALPDADVITEGDDTAMLAPDPTAGPPATPAELLTDEPGDLRGYLLIAARITRAGVYVRLGGAA